jgi:hypothetical protein
MNRATIHLLTRIKGITLLVFYTNAHAWQFRVLSATGEVFGSKQIFYSSEAAEREGRAWVQSKGKAM